MKSSYEVESIKSVQYLIQADLMFTLSDSWDPQPELNKWLKKTGWKNEWMDLFIYLLYKTWTDHLDHLAATREVFEISFAEISFSFFLLNFNSVFWEIRMKRRTKQAKQAENTWAWLDIIR